MRYKEGTKEKGSKKTVEMSMSNLFKDQTAAYPFFTRKLLPYIFYALLSMALLWLYFYPLLRTPPRETDEILLFSPINITSHYSSSPTSLPPSSNFPLAEEEKSNETLSLCDYFSGQWESDRRGPLYNGTTCGTIKEGQNCINHGRPDLGYLYWRWKPSQCHLPRFEPETFLKQLKDKNLAFVGDSLARNQLESLLCMLATSSTPQLVYQNGEENKFRRWHFPSHNTNISIYWSPFLVDGIEKSNGINYNKLFLDHVDEIWARDLDQMDLIVLSIGHWFLLPAVYYEGDSALGCHYCPDLNHTEIGFYDVLRKALRITLSSIIERKSAKDSGIDVILTMFSPHHFEGDWDKAGACPKTSPYINGEKELEGMDAEMRKIEIEELEAAKAKYKEFGGFIRLEALDVTKLALMRPDGHPGPYMNPFPFVNGVQDRVQNDCVHWCLPGPIDTWNEIFLEIIKKWMKDLS